ncbi:NAD-dependent epimerase/dehydratase family protein [Clostridium sp.]|uniref:NAD-dependent epimerase/dehydratase family protein n=1 Tax=Clostridium sp. TaxID=1506 RepID=UPI00261DDBE3|nr:NAD-dependent epimerase/dehydratase family protein [Clostridium sp.]
MKKILITGSNGFIGKNLSEQLAKEYNIYAPKREELNLLDQNSVEKYLTINKFDVVIHSAIQNTLGEAKVFESHALDRNLRMFFNLERCKEEYGKMYYFGSGGEYDMENYIPSIPEDFFGTFIPNDAYGFSKYIMSNMVNNSSNIYDLRLFGVFGKYENWEHRFISNSICKVINNMPIKIRQNVNFDYLYIDDLCEIMKWFIDNIPNKKHYNVCTGTKVDLITISKKIIKYSQKDLNITVEKSGLNREYTGNNSRLIGEIGGYEFQSIDESIEDLYKYYLSVKEKIDYKKLVD